MLSKGRIEDWWENQSGSIQGIIRDSPEHRNGRAAIWLKSHIKSKPPYFKYKTLETTSGFWILGKPREDN